MTQPPRRNLPPDSEIWGRWVDEQLTLATAETNRSLQSISNTLSGVNGALTQLSSQVADIAKQQEISSLSTSTFTNAASVTLVATTPTPQSANLGPAVPVSLAPNTQVTAIFTSPVSLAFTPLYWGDFISGGIKITASGGISDFQGSEFMLQAPVANSQLGGSVTLTCVMNLRNRTTSTLSVSLQLGAYGSVLTADAARSGSIVVSNGTLLVQTAYLAPLQSAPLFI